MLKIRCLGRAGCPWPAKRVVEICESNEATKGLVALPEFGVQLFMQVGQTAPGPPLQRLSWFPSDHLVPYRQIPLKF